MASERIDLEAIAGSRFDTVFTLKNPDGSPINLTGCAAEVTFRPAVTDPAAITLAASPGVLVQAETGAIAVHLTAAQTAAQSGAILLFDGRVWPTGGDPETFVRGRLTVTPKA